MKCWVLKGSDLDRIAESRPRLKIMLLGKLAALLADKLKQANDLVSALAR